MELAPLGIEFEPRLQPIVTAWAAMTPWQQRRTTLDDLATRGGLTPSEFLTAVVRASFEFTGDITDLLVACAFPSVVVASIKRARTRRGFRDRELLLQHVASLQTAKAAENARRTSHSKADLAVSEQLERLRNGPGAKGTTH